MIYILMSSIADRARGTRAIFVWLFAYILAQPFDSYLLMLAIVLGESAGWGAPLSAFIYRKINLKDKEWWETKYLVKHPKLAVITRGIMWGLPVLLVGLYLSSFKIAILSIAFPLSFTAGAYLARIVNKGKWDLMEYSRGFLLGTFFYIVSIL